MYISPKYAIAQGWITGIDDPELQVQPNAIDFPLNHLFSISDSPFFLAEGHKEMRGGNKITPVSMKKNGDIYDTFVLEPRTVYDGLSKIHVDLPEGVAAELIIRSTLNRNGIFLTSGLYDSGYCGNLGFAIHNQSGGIAHIEQGVRIGQIKFVRSDKGGLYSGGWNHEDGSHWSTASNQST